MKSCVVYIVLLILLFASCNSKNKSVSNNDSLITNELVIFHAGSLSVPIKEISEAFKKQYPQIKIKSESAGSIACARKITELGQPCDIIAVSDYKVIDQLLIPLYAAENNKFATNEMVIAYTEKSKLSNTINNKNWYEILLKDDVLVGRSDPNSDPCGYRTIFTFKLSEIFYNKMGIYSKLIEKSKNYIRPKEVDLLALIESNTIDYIFIYKSVAVQHGLEFLILPDEINLKNPKFADYYSKVFTLINSKKPNALDTIYGEPMIYSLAILKSATNKMLAKKYFDFFLSEAGLSIIEKNGQPKYTEQ